MNDLFKQTILFQVFHNCLPQISILEYFVFIKKILFLLGAKTHHWTVCNKLLCIATLLKILNTVLCWNIPFWEIRLTSKEKARVNQVSWKMSLFLAKIFTKFQKSEILMIGTLLKIESATFFLVCFLSLKESPFETRKMFFISLQKLFSFKF